MRPEGSRFLSPAQGAGYGTPNCIGALKVRDRFRARIPGETASRHAFGIADLQPAYNGDPGYPAPCAGLGNFDPSGLDTHWLSPDHRKWDGLFHVALLGLGIGFGFRLL